ncbi:hypothetical protein [Streptomyces sp. NPDC005385]|uniref:hypothetical protein n=1 Tax=Streptomyces sp. NPDC005385 TaxID=3157039 RepID=UPI0033B193B8
MPSDISVALFVLSSQSVANRQCSPREAAVAVTPQFITQGTNREEAAAVFSVLGRCFAEPICARVAHLDEEVVIDVQDPA